MPYFVDDFFCVVSPSSRRAWIEIEKLTGANYAILVALLAEGVDRNFNLYVCCHASHVSPSSRRAWIEILCDATHQIFFRVALLAEGVDRNNKNSILRIITNESPSSRRAWIEIGVKILAVLLDFSRPPRGGRG